MSNQLDCCYLDQLGLEPLNGSFTNKHLTDIKLIQLWLHDKSSRFQKKASLLIKRFFDIVRKRLSEISLDDLQFYLDNLQHNYSNDGTRKNHVNAIKSLLKFGHKIGYLSIDLGKLITTPKVKNNLSERIVTPEKIIQMIALEPNLRNHLILKLLYATGIRNAELCGLKWRDVQVRSDNLTQINVYGKGNKTRSIVLPQSIAKELLNFRGNAHFDEPIFPSKKKKFGGHLDTTSVQRLVQAARLRAGIEENVVPHCFRHSHASHALEQGAPIHLVRDTLGHSSIKITAQYLHVRPGDTSARFLMD